MKKTLIQKHKKDELLTKNYLDKKFKVNQKYFDNEFQSFSNRIINYVNLRLEPMEEEIKKVDSIDSRLESINKTLDWLAGKYKEFEEEHTVLTEQNSRNINKLDNHEERISNLEKRIVAA